MINEIHDRKPAAHSSKVSGDNQIIPPRPMKGQNFVAIG